MVSKNQIILGLVCSILQCVLAQEPGPQNVSNFTAAIRLRHKLLLNYDRIARPTEHYNATTLKYGIEIMHLDIDEFASTIQVFSWAKMSWVDERLKWNPEEYGGLSLVHMSKDEVWLPDVFLYNSYNPTAMKMYGDTMALVYSSGEVLWVPPTNFVALCELDFTFWPFDKQVCMLKFGSWTYDGSKIDLQMRDDSTEVEVYKSYNDWLLVGRTAERNDHFYSCCKESYPAITVNLTVQRISPSYKALIITPAIAIIMLTLMNFWLPPQAGEKIILNGVTAIITTLFMLYFAQKVPAMRSQTPLIVFFFSSSLYIICFSMANSILVLWISRTKHSKPIPSVLKQILIGWLGKWLCLSPSGKESSVSANRPASEELKNHQPGDLEEQNSSDDRQTVADLDYQRDWMMLALAIDRVAFVFYGCLFAILAIVYCL